MYLSVIGARCQDVSELGVGPGDLPHGSLVALEDAGERLDAPLLEVEDSHAAVGAAGGEPRAVVVHLGIVDEVVVVRVHGALERNHGRLAERGSDDPRYREVSSYELSRLRPIQRFCICEPDTEPN